MDIISQFLANELLNYFITEWRVETMLALIVFLLTYFFMQKRIKHYKKLSEIYAQDINKTSEMLKECHLALVDIKNILQQEKDKIDKENLLNELKDIINDTLQKFSEGLEK